MSDKSTRRQIDYLLDSFHAVVDNYMEMPAFEKTESLIHALINEAETLIGELEELI